MEQLRASVAQAQSLEFELSELQAEIDTAVEAADSAGPDLVPPHPMRWLGVSAVLVIIGWLSMFVLRDAGVLAFVVVASLAVAVTITLVQAFRMARKRRQFGLAMQLAQSEIEAHRELARDHEEAHRRKRRELEGLLESLGADNVRAAQGLLASTEEQSESLAQIEGELRGLRIDERNIHRLEEARDQAAGEAAQTSHALAAMGALGEDPARARAAAQRELALTTPARDTARSEADQAEGRVGANTVDAELVASLAERLSAARERYVELERRALTYEGTLAAIEAAEAATLKTAARYLEEHMGPTIKAVTGGRYDDIVVDEKSLAFQVRAPESGELVEVDQLSQGTADQLYLAARLGLVRLVTLDRRPPLILDDPFVTFDPSRAQRALRLIREMAHEHDFQVLYLTCTDRYDSLADEVVVLPGPSRERVASPSADDAPVSAAMAGSAGDAPEPTLRFEPDPRPNPNPVAPRIESDDETVTMPLFAEAAQEEAEAAARLAELRAARATEDDAPDPLDSLRRTAQDAEVADPFSVESEERD